MKYDYVLDSSVSVYEAKYDIDRSKSEEITVYFENEGVVLTADRAGNYTFAKADGTVIKNGKAESDRCFMFIYCSVKDNVINVRFPVTETVDHYPNCDGEYDRYSTKIVDNIIVTCPVG